MRIARNPKLKRSYPVSGGRMSVPNPQNPYEAAKLTPMRSPAIRPVSLFAAPPERSPPIPPLREPPHEDPDQRPKNQHGPGAVPENYLKHEAILESFLRDTITMPVHEAIERTIGQTLKAENVMYWQDVPNLHCLYSKHASEVVNHSAGLVGFTFFSREVLKAKAAGAHDAYRGDIDGKLVKEGDPVMLFPLWDYNNNVCGVVELTRDPTKPFFDDEDDEFVQFFVNKFKVYSYWLFKSDKEEDLSLELLQTMELEQFLLLFQRKICTMFRCNSCELWKYNTMDKSMTRYLRSGVSVEARKSGIVGEAMSKECPLNCAQNKMLSSYLPDVDGNETEPVLVVPVVKQDVKYAVALRGRKGINIFTTEDETRLRDIAPYIVLALDNNEKFSATETATGQGNPDRKFVSVVTTLVELLQGGEPIPSVLKRALESAERLVNADRSYVFSHDKERDVMKVVATTYANPCSSEIPVGRGIVGLTWSDVKVYNVADASEEPKFDMVLDLETGYHTRSLLSIPVVNNRLQPVAVAQFLNKKDGKPFSVMDVKAAQVLMMFCGLILENERMFDISNKSTSDLKRLTSACKAIATSDQLKGIVSNILTDAQHTVGTERASVFLVDDVVGVFSTFVSDEPNMPSTIPLSHGIGANTVKKYRSALEKQVPVDKAKMDACTVVNDAYHDPAFNKMIDYHTKYKTKSVLACPIVSSKGVLYGVMELVNKNDGADFTQNDKTMMFSYANLAGVAVEMQKMTEITTNGASQLEMAKWIGDLEQNTTETPSRLAIPMQKKDEIWAFDFKTIDWNGIGLFKVVFGIFKSFEIMDRFKISNNMLFQFLYTLRETYNDVPYHNWIHAVDVFQFYAYEIKRCCLTDTLNVLEILAICVASLGHDAGHKGFDNRYNIATLTPYGILYKDSGSVMEFRHCGVLIDVISQPQANIFRFIPEEQLCKLWQWIIQMILATDIGVQQKILKGANDLMDIGPINLANEQHRLLAMKLLMMLANVSNVCRTFEIAHEWWDLLMEECWKQGDLERAQALELSNPCNDREAPEKEQFEIVFIQDYCLPLMQVVARIFAELDEITKACTANLEKWKGQIGHTKAEINDPEEEEA